MHSLPLNPNNTHRPLQPLPSSSKPAQDFLDCEEDIQIISLPISNFNKDSLFPTSFSPNSLPKWSLSDQQYLSSLISKELEYMPNPYYLQTMQPCINSIMRLILYDWMMEVCSELMLKRETFHLSVNYCDRYLSRCTGVRKEEFQLIGLCCMYLAAKVEEVLPPPLSDWANSADNGYSVDAITAMEKKLLRSIDFKIFPATACHWTTWLMTQWDSYLDFHFSCVPGNNLKDLDQYADKRRVKNSYETRMILFKQASQKAYRRFRETIQVLDVAILHPNSMLFLPKQLACGLLYLMISKYFFESNYALLYYNGDLKDIAEEIANSEADEVYRLESTADVQELYEEFIKAAAGLNSIEEIYSSVAFFHQFLDFEPCFELPVACKIQTKAKLEAHYEDFLAYQTHNTNNLEFVQNILKSI